MILFSCSANPHLAAQIATILNVQWRLANFTSFPDGESKVEIIENVQGQNIFIIQPTCAPVNQHIMELCLLATALKQAGAAKLTAVIPYFGYARQKHGTRMVCQMLASVGIADVITVDLHTDPKQGYAGLPITNLSTTELFAHDLLQQDFPAPVIVAPDLGGICRALKFAGLLGVDLVTTEKLRSNNTVSASILNGDVTNRNCVIVDDMIDSSATLCATAQALINNGAARIMAYCTHAVLSSDVMEHLLETKCEQIVVTDSILLSRTLPTHRLRQISIAQLLVLEILTHTGICATSHISIGTP